MDPKAAVNELVEARLTEGRSYGMGLGHGIKYDKKYNKKLNPFQKNTFDWGEYERGFEHGQKTKSVAKHFADPDKVGGVGLRVAAGIIPGADFAVSVAQHLFSGKRPR